MTFAVVLVMMLLTTTDVVLRYLFNNPLPGIFEIVAMLMVFVVFLSLAYTQSIRGHIRVDLLTTHLSGVPQRCLSIIGYSIALFIFGIMTWQAGLAAHKAWLSGDYAMGLVSYPLWPAKWALVIGLGFFSLRFVSDIFVELCSLRTMLQDQNMRVKP